MSTKRGPYAKSDARRRLLSAAALELVRQKGHRNVAISEIAEFAETSEPTVYYHFPTKESLLIAALKQHDDENTRARDDEAGPIAEMGGRAEAGVQRTNYARLYNELAGAAADPAHPANPFFRERWSRSVAVVAADIRRLQELGRVPDSVDADDAAHLLLAAWEGLQLQWMQGPPFDIRALIESHIRALLGPDAID
ncbi:TetR/AcrR family transcriptional regulator [Microbacterium trichothecenolyticum]|uniref:TetR/AcrR family transcriptional regulator n=1 Tax=Microbacterium trichothecenolyticum TaxID=69370 RepID=UPI001C6DFEAC|nr:TetR/AcrR family transcriptional regulator [Microbacterium trichothecenolyticum]MBW9120473.1 TetR/AcrR family transcriptional regulator [Microbacterium trichothecenolyticum]